jgi:hypothetical protein
MPDLLVRDYYSILIQLPAHGATWYCWATPEPVLATAEEAAEMFSNVRSKVQSFLSKTGSAVPGFVCYERRDFNPPGGLQLCADECVIPAAVLASSIIRYYLVKH